MATAALISQETSANLPAKVAVRRAATDDEILGISTDSGPLASGDQQLGFNWDVDDAAPGKTTRAGKDGEPQAGAAAKLKTVLDANPDLRSAWDDAAAYRKTFATPEEARTANTRLADLDRLDSLFFSQRPEDHAELARAVAALDPSSFDSLAKAMAQLVSARQAGDAAGTPSLGQDKQHSAVPSPNTERVAAADGRKTDQSASPADGRELSAAQTQFFHGANAAAVEEVLQAIESQVEKILPEEISKSARNRVVGEIYRELDTTLRSNRQLAQQMRDAFRSGSLDAEHQKAIVSLVTGRARQALPAVAKRVLNEWTSTIVAANQDRRARQRTAERRVDILGSGGVGNEGRRPTSARDIDYARMSDSDILNL